MAIDLKQEVSIESIRELFKSAKKGASQLNSNGYPTKTTMNLYQGDKRTVELRKLLFAGVFGLILLGAFVKVGILDQFALLSQKEAELAQQQSLVMAVMSKSGDYESVKQLYDSYTAKYGDGSLDAILVLDMVEQRVKPVANVTSIVLSNDTLTLSLSNVPLNTVGDLAKTLESQPMVKSVNVSTATAQNSQGNTVSTLVVTLVSGSGKE